jgi:DNA-binding transcriptional MerR regulator
MLTIGRLARAAGLTTDTIRFYEREGLLHPQSRTDTGYRLYEHREVRRLGFIKHAQQCGLSLRTIDELMRVPEDGDVRESVAYWAARRELPEIDRRIAALQSLRGGLRTFIDLCAAKPGHARFDPTEVLTEVLDALFTAESSQAEGDTPRAALRDKRDASSTVAA